MSADHEQLLPPNDPAAFESLCLDLWREIWGDPGAQKNGRSGQPQAGVDVFGRTAEGWAGVQCKQKDGLLRTELTAAELEAEVAKARTFEPPLRRFIVATSGPRDAKVQAKAREITDGGFVVEVWSWPDIWHELYQRRELLGRIKPVYWPLQTALGVQRISPSRLPRVTGELFGRENELADLDVAWNDPKTHVVTLVAWGGVGKTSLVAKWVAGLAARDFDGADYFDWSFYSQGTREEGEGGASADAFMDEALRFFGDEEMAESARSAWEKGERLAQLVARRRALLVLDGLEPLQYPPGPLAGELKDPAMKVLLKGLAGRNPGLCVVTTREPVVDLASYAGSTLTSWDLEDLPAPVGIELLKAQGVHGPLSDFRKLVDDVHGHALTLSILAAYLAKAHGGDVRRRDRVKLSKADRKKHAFNVMLAYEKWLEANDELGRCQLAILRLMGLFDRLASAGCIRALRRGPVIEGLTEPLMDLGDEDWDVAVGDLVAGRLLSRPADRGRELSVEDRGSLDAHPLVREHFGRRLQKEQPEAWKAAHGRLFDHLKDTTERWPDTLVGLQPLYQAVVHGCLAGRPQEAGDDIYYDRILRGNSSDRFYSAKKLGAFGANLGAVVCFFEAPWSRVSPSLTESDQAWLLNEAATSLRALGRLAEAVEPMRVGLQLYLDAELWRPAAITAGNVSELAVSLGDIAAAARDAERSVDYADRSEEWEMRIIMRTTLADALHHAGQRIDALARFREAESLQAEWQPQYPLLYSLQGFRYWDLLLADAERAAAGGARAAGVVGVCGEVERRASLAIEWADLNRAPLLDSALSQLTLGRPQLYRAILEGTALDDAEVNIVQAVDDLRSAGIVELIVRGLLTLAWLRSRQGAADAARAALDEAQEIAERGPMPLHLCDVALYRARLFHDRAALAEARRLMVKHGYWRRKGEIEDLEAVADQW